MSDIPRFKDHSPTCVFLPSPARLRTIHEGLIPRWAWNHNIEGAPDSALAPDLPVFTEPADEVIEPLWPDPDVFYGDALEAPSVLVFTR